MCGSVVVDSVAAVVARVALVGVSEIVADVTQDFRFPVLAPWPVHYHFHTSHPLSFEPYGHSWGVLLGVVGNSVVRYWCYSCYWTWAAPSDGQQKLKISKKTGRTAIGGAVVREEEG
jgi:hypothetical protein